MRGEYWVAIGVLVVFLGVFMAGCADEEVRNPQVSMEVEEVEAVDVDCLELDTDEECHRLTVNIQNQNEQEPFDVNTFYWKAIAETGEAFEVPDEEGPDSIQAGSQGQVTLAFEVTPDTKLRTLQYETPLQDSPLNATVPNYQVETWQPPVSVQVQEVTAVEIDCDERSNETHCHSVAVQVSNDHEEDDADTSAGNWKATTQDGDVIDTFSAIEVEGSETLSPGSQAEVTVHIDAEPGDLLESITYQPSFAPRGLETSLPDYEVEAYDPGVRLTVTNVDTQSSRCPDYSDDTSEHCHSIDVNVENTHDEESADMNQFNWEATASDGGTYDPWEVQGPDSVGPGSESSVTVQVELPAGENAETLSYQDSWMPQPVEVPVE